MSVDQTCPTCGGDDVSAEVARNLVAIGLKRCLRCGWWHDKAEVCRCGWDESVSKYQFGPVDWRK